MSASVNPIERIIINKNKTYLGALDVIEKILPGSKYLNILIKYQFNLLFVLWKNLLIKNAEGDNNEGIISSTLDQD